jgi:hypothetical protein
MFTLSDASRDTKDIIKWGGIFLSIVIVVLLLVRLGFFIKDLLYPAPPPAPTVSFGKLQGQSFPVNAVNQTFTYSTNTLTGDLPVFLDQIKVYRMKLIKPDLLAVKNYSDKVGNVGFVTEHVAISDKVFEWKASQLVSNLDRRIRVNIVNDSFTITSPYMSDESILKAVNLPDVEKAKTVAKDFLDGMGVMPDDINQDEIRTNLFSIQNGRLVTATSLSNSQVIEVNFYQKDIDKLPIYYEKPNSSNISMLVAGGNFQGQVVGGTFIHQGISNESSTYPIKTASEAFEELKKGNAYFASYFGKGTNISITNIFLAYYISSQAQDFLMPVIVFEGNDGFFAYVSAVKDEWIDK